MNVLSQLTRLNIRLNKTRSLSALGSIFLAAAMFTILTTAVYSLWDYVRRGTEYETGDYFVSCDYVDDAELAVAQSDLVVRRVSDMRITGHISLYERLGPGGMYPVAAVDTAFFKDMSVPLKEGRFPENSAEILVPEEINHICLMEGWKTWEIGDTVSLDLFDIRMAQVVKEGGRTSQYRPDETWPGEYRIVGTTANKNYSDDPDDWAYYPLLTLADGEEGAVLWHRLFLRTDPGDAGAVHAKHYGQKSFLNQDLLRVYGAEGVGQETAIALLIIPAALLLIGLFSVVLIRSVFSVSVTERTREFGLLASIGSTPRQIRGLVRREAWFFLAAALPLGLAAGVLSAGALLSLYRATLTRQFTFGEKVALSVRLSPVALVTAALICTITVLLSVRGPSRRAARIIPIEAIRQNRDIQVREKKGGTRFLKILGVPGWVGIRYEKTIRKKSRAVTAALAFSLILFLPAVYLAGLAEKQADQYTDGFDFELYSAGGRIDSEIIDRLRAEPEVSSSVLYSGSFMFAAFPSADLPEAYKETNAGTFEQKDYSSAYSVEQLRLVYLEDSAFSAVLAAEGLDPEPYFAEDKFLAVNIPFSTGGFAVPDEKGGWRTVLYKGYGPDDMPEELLCVALGVPYEISTLKDGIVSPSAYLATDDGQLLLSYAGKLWLLEFEAAENRGEMSCVFRSYDASTGKIGDIGATMELPYLRLRPQGRLAAAPDGFGNLNNISFVLPLSKLPEDKYVTLGINIRSLSDYYSLLAKLDNLVKDNPLLVYNDYRESTVNALGMAALIRGISTDFLILISLFCAVNVFYTISTNLLLRRRDLGILQSIGFTRKDLLRMAAVENAGSGVRALLSGLPVGIGLCYVLYRMEKGSSSAVFRLPWSALLLGAGLIFLLMLAGILYSMRLLRKQTPLEAIRQAER